MESRKVLHTTVISNVIVTILCFASTSTATVRERCFVLATCTVLIAGKSCWNRSYNGMKTRNPGRTFVVMLHLQSLRSMNTLKRKSSCMLSAFGRMISCMMRLNICWLVLLVVLRENRLCGFMTSSIGQPHGTRGAGLWRRLSGTVEIYSREWVLSWPTWVPKQRVSYVSTMDEGLLSSG